MSGLVPPTHLPGDARPPNDDPHLLLWEQRVRHSTSHGVTSALSRSELDVLEDAANGLTARESALERSKSPETVKSQRTSVLTKLGARNMVQAVAITVQERQITGEHETPIRFA